MSRRECSFGDPNYREIIDFEEIIGVHLDAHTGKQTPTSIGEIYYNEKGEYHIVPVNPNRVFKKIQKDDTSQEELGITCALNSSMYRALKGEVIPSLRKITLRWYPEEGRAIFTFYHHGEVTDIIENHYSCIITEVHADFAFEYFQVDHEIEICNYPAPIPKGGHTVYLRKEPFEDPKDE